MSFGKPNPDGIEVHWAGTVTVHCACGEIHTLEAPGQVVHCSGCDRLYRLDAEVKLGTQTKMIYN